MGFLKFILVVLIIYVSFRLIFKYFGKAILAWLGKKAMQRVQRSFEARAGFNPNDMFNQGKAQKNNSQKSSQPLEKKTVGEYIDFEEID